MTWDAVIFDFEDTLVDLSRGRSMRTGPVYFNGAKGARPVVDLEGRPFLDAVSGLISSGTPVALVTASPEAAVRRWLSEQQFTLPVTVVGFHDTVLHRPSPHPLLSGLQSLGVPATSRVLSIGDSADDIEAGQRAGLTTGTLRPLTPLSMAPERYLPLVDSFLNGEHVWGLAGDLQHTGPKVTLVTDRGDHQCRVAGRLPSDGGSRLSSLISRSRAGRWPDELVELMVTLVEHTLVDDHPRPVLTTIPPHTGRPDRLRTLLGRMKSATGLPCTRLLSFEREPGEQSARPWDRRASAVENTMCMRGSPDLTGRSILVIDDVRGTGATLAEAARVLLDAGAERVVGLALAQEEHRDGEPLAEYGPLLLCDADEALVDDDLDAIEAVPVSPRTRSVPPRPARRPSLPRFEPDPPPAPVAPPPVRRQPAPVAAAPELDDEIPAPQVAAPEAQPAWPSLFEDSSVAAEREPVVEQVAPQRASEPEAVPVVEWAPESELEPEPVAEVAEPVAEAQVAEPVAEVVAEPEADPVEETRRARPRAFNRWTPEEDALLAELFDAGEGIFEMAEELSRVPKAVESRIRKLQLDCVPDDEEDDEDEEGDDGENDVAA